MGAFVDRGSKQLETVGIAPDGGCGHAVAAMGNHELNTIAWFLRDMTGARRFALDALEAHAEKGAAPHSPARPSETSRISIACSTPARI